MPPNDLRNRSCTAHFLSFFFVFLNNNILFELGNAAVLLIFSLSQLSLYFLHV